MTTKPRKYRGETIVPHSTGTRSLGCAKLIGCRWAGVYGTCLGVIALGCQWAGSPGTSAGWCLSALVHGLQEEQAAPPSPIEAQVLLGSGDSSPQAAQLVPWGSGVTPEGTITSDDVEPAMAVTSRARPSRPQLGYDDLAPSLFVVAGAEPVRLAYALGPDGPSGGRSSIVSEPLTANFEAPDATPPPPNHVAPLPRQIHPHPLQIASPTPVDEVADVWSLPQLIDIALSRNPEVEAARQDVEKARMRLPQVGSLEDPMLSVNGWPFFPAVPQTAAGRMRAEIMMSQQLPWFGKLPARVGAAAAEVLAAESRLQQIELRVAQEVTDAYLDDWMAGQELRIVQTDIELLSELATTLDALYRTGRVGQSDVLRLNAEIGMGQSQQVAVEEKRIRARAELTRALHWTHDLPPAIDSRLPPGEALASVETLIDMALAQRPELRELWARIEREQWRVRQARLEYYPDVNLRVGWGDMTTRGSIVPFADGIDSVTTGLDVNVPIRRARRDAAVAEAESAWIAGGQDLERLRNETMRDVRQLHAEIQRIEQQLELYEKQIVPPVQQAWQVTVEGYQVGEASFNDLIEVRRQWLRLQLEQARLQFDRQMATARLQRVLGVLL